MKIEDEVLERLRDLPEDKKREALRYITELSKVSKPPSANKPTNETLADLAKAEQAMRWIAEHRDEYIGQWVALDGNRLVASGSDAHEVIQKARDEGVRAPFFDRVEAEAEGGEWGGWV